MLPYQKNPKILGTEQGPSVRRCKQEAHLLTQVIVQWAHLLTQVIVQRGTVAPATPENPYGPQFNNARQTAMNLMNTLRPCLDPKTFWILIL